MCYLYLLGLSLDQSQQTRQNNISAMPWKVSCTQGKSEDVYEWPPHLKMSDLHVYTVIY